MTIQEFYKELEQHDWFHMMSDDGKVDARGFENYKRLRALVNGRPDWDLLMTQYSDYVWSSVNGPRLEKPKNLENKV